MTATRRTSIRTGPSTILLSCDAKASGPCNWNRHTGIFKSKKASEVKTSSPASKVWKTSANRLLRCSTVARSIGVAIFGVATLYSLSSFVRLKTGIR